MSSLAEQLQILHECGFSSDDASLYEAEKQVKEIEQTCSRRLTKQELGLYCSLLFHKDGGILPIISKNVAKPQHKNVREGILTFLSTFVSRIVSYVRPYVSDIHGCCNVVYRSDRFAKNKIKALKVLAELIAKRSIAGSFEEEQIKGLVKMLFEEIATTKCTSTVKGQSFHMLGTLARYYPEFMTNHSERLFDIFLRGLRKEMITSNKASDLNLIEGYLLGLHALLFSFTASYDEVPVTRCKEIFKFARMSLQPQNELSRFAVPLAGMKLLKDHAAQFGPLLVESYESYYNVLNSWFEHKNPQLKHEAHAALDSFLQQVASTIADEKGASSTSKQLFMFFIRKFKLMINSSDTSSKVMSLAVRGYGLFAGACRLFLSKSDVRHMFSEMMSKCEQMFLSGEEGIDDNKIHQLPSFIQSLANITQQLEMDDDDLGSSQGLSESFMSSLCRLCVLLVEKYPRLHRKYYFFCHSCILSAVHAFDGRPDVRDAFLERITYHGLIRSCSYGVVLGEERSKNEERGSSLAPPSGVEGDDIIDDVINDSRTITYKDYVSLWSSLMSENRWSESTDFVDRSNLSVNRKELCQTFTSIFIKSVLKIVTKLNLSASNTKDQNDDSIPNPGLLENLQAENADDFKFFINIVDLCWDLLPNVMLPGSPAAKAFSLHFQITLQQLVALSTRFPLVSGFYKLLATIVKISCKLNYFCVTKSAESFLESQGDSQESMDVTESDKMMNLFARDRQETLVLLQKFAIEVVSRQKQHKDDLLASSLFFLLSLPANAAAGIISHLTPAVQRVAVLGLSYFPLASALISALERWKEDYIKNPTELEQVIISLQPFLASEQGSDSVVLEKVKLNKKSKSSIKKQKNIKEAEESTRKRMRSRVVRYLGSLGGSVLSFLKKPDEGNEVAVADWDKDIVIKYAVPFRDLKPEIRLDLYLPRVMEIASQSSDRQAKIAACELMHSIVLYTIGTNAQTSNMKSVSGLMPSLYKKLFPVLLRLACDVDQVCKQMFEPLMKQIIHWFTNNQQFESPSTATLLNALMDSLVDFDNAALRELSAQLLCEFLAWSVKQNTVNTSSSPTNAKSILKRIYSLARHPSSAKRLGATVAFNHLYRVFREQETLVDDYTLEILVTFIDCLALSHDDDSSLGTESSCVQSLKHIERIVKAKFKILNKPSNNRRIPKGFNPTQPVTLVHVVEWMFDQCGRPQTECRHQCMRLFYDFVKLIPDDKLRSATLWINKKKEKDGTQYFVKKFESGNGGNGIQTYTFLSSVCSKFSVKSACNWFDLVLAALEAYSWLFQEKLLTPVEVLCENRSASFLFRSLRYFICDVAQIGIEDLASKLVKSKSQVFVFTPQDTQTYNHNKCSLISRTLQFFAMLLQRFPDTVMKVIPDDFWTRETLLSLICTTTVCPSTLGFDTLNDENVVENLRMLSTKIVSLLLKHLPTDKKLLFVKLMAEKLTEFGNLIDLLPIPFNEEGPEKSLPIQDLVRGYAILSESKMLDEIITNESQENFDVEMLRNRIFESVFGSVVSKGDDLQLNPVTLAPKDVEIGNMLLQLALKLGLDSETLVSRLYDNTGLISYDRENKLRNTHGQMFVAVYSKKICEAIVSNPSSYIPALIDASSSNLTTCTNILISTLEYLTTDRIARKKYSASVCGEILNSWSKLKCFWHDDSSLKDENSQSNALDILRRIFALDAKVCTEPKHPAFEAVFEMYKYMLTSAKLNLSFKLQALDLLSFFTLASDHNDQLKSSLENFVANHFPLSSRELSPGSTSHNEYCSAIKKILLCLEMTGNLMILQILISIFCREEHHCLFDEVQNTFHVCVKSIPTHQQKSALDIPFHNFITSRSPVTRRHAVCDVIVPMVTRCDVVSLVEFFSAHVNEVMDILKEDTKRYPESQWIDQLERKSLAYRILELMFSVLPKEQIEPSSSIGQASASSQNKESLMKAFMMRANRDRNENLEGESQLLEERRKFHCSVYNAMIASVVCTQTEQKWYKAFLFDENPPKNQFFLNNVIPTESKYKFEVEMTEPLVKRKRFVAIRKAKKEENNENEGMMFAPYMASIAGSSLSEEVSAFDGNRGRTVQISSLQSDTLGFESASTRESPTNFSHQNNFVELEANSLNEHECMPAMVGVITHMHHNKIGFPSGDAPAGQLPQWMLSIHKKFSSSSTHPNIRIFIAKLIVNCEECFRPYAKYWIAPLIQTIVRGDCCVDGIDWMTCDVLATALSWNSVAIPEETVEGRGLVQGLLEHLAEKFSCDNRALLRHNLDLIKATLECWGSRVKSGINPKLVYDLCGSTDSESKSNFAGLQLLGALLANGISPYTSSYVVDRSAYFKRIFQNIVYKRKEIYDSAAEVGGMTLRYLTEIEKETEGEIHEMVVAKLTLLSRDPKRQDVFITSLHKVASHYPPIVDQFLSRVMFLIPKVHGDLLTYCFEIILERAESIEELFTQLKAKNFISKLSIGNEALQLVCLRLCRSVISNKSSDVTNDDVMMFFGQIAKHFPQHASVLCRQEAANVAMEIYDAQMSLPSDKRSSEILSSSRLFLLKLLHDPEEALRNQIVNFWSSEDRLPIQASAKLGSLLGQMYDSALDEVNYLSNTVSLLLQSASLSPDFERPMFDHPLSECVFQEYTIDNRWRYRHASMTPLFADTLQAGGSSGDSPNKLLSPPSSRQPNVVMATQDNLQFSATVDMTGKNTYNWMTGSSLDTFSSLAAFGQPERKSALLVGSSGSGARYRPALSKLKLTDPDFGKKKMVYTGTDNFGSRKGAGVDVNVERLRRRFRKESDESRMKFARAQERRNKIKEVAKTEAARRRETEVQLHRKYRTGELPDVQIPHRSIVAPLAAACQHDPHLCRIVLSSLVLALLEEETKIGKKLSKERIDAVLSGLGSILDRSAEKNPALIGCIQDVCYHDSRVEELLPPALVASSSLASNKHALGIVILEQMILNKRTDEPATKRRKVPGPGFESCPETWLQLARLYKSLGDFDVLSGIFGAGSNPTSSRGLSLEAQNSYKEARKVYEQALNDEDTDASDVERDMWEDCLLNCVKQMSRWDHVNFLCDSMLERYDNVTSDDVNPGSLKAALLHQDYQDRFLDSAVHAKLLLLLQGRMEVGEQLSSFFDDVMQSDVDRKSHVERRYSEHLTMLYIYKDDFDRARYYLNLTAEHATQRWSLVGGGAGRKGEQEIFRVVPLVSDLHEFLDFAQSPDDDVTEHDVRRIAGGWMTRMPHLTYDPITSWHDVISYRTFLMDRMSDRLSRILDDSEDRRDSWLSGCRSKMLIEMMRSAFTRGNFVVAEKILRALEKDYESLKENARIDLSQATASFYHARGRRQVVTGEEQSGVKYCLAAFQALQEQTPELGSVESIRHNMLLASTYHMTSQSLEGHPDDAIMEEIRVMAGNDQGDLQQILINNAFGVFEKAVKESEKYGEELQYEAYTNLASFCDKQLQRSEENSSTGEDSTARKPTQYAVTMTTCFLRAMRLHGGGRSIATLRFPRLLQLLEKFGDEMRSGFVQESQSVPSWNFLPWLGHMVALLDGDVATFLHPIMMQVSRDYPQAVVYPLCAAQQGFCYKRSETGKKNKSFVKKLLTSLHEAIPLAKEFIRQLQQVSDPVVLFKDWFNEFSKLHKNKKDKTATNKDLLVSYQNMYRELFDHDRPADDVTEQGSASLFGSVTSQSPVTVGALRTKFAKDFKADVDGLFGGSSGSALLQMRDFKREAGALYKRILDKFKSQAMTLQDYSPWLANFQSLQCGDKDLEIPGQYDGRARPLVEYHVTVVGFDERVQVMSSLRKPCRVIIRGSDEREHRFLVKGGEDLRQDQRIEQIFVSINDIFNDNSTCRERSFSIVTYQVIPINAKVGLIEWVPNVVPYLELMTKQAGKMGCESTMKGLLGSSWVPANILQVARDHTEKYGLLMHKGTYTDVVDLFNRRQNKLPWNMLREVYFRMSADPESFLNLRKRFISSYGVMSIVHWLLGIGDRHPSNFMVSMTTGHAVGIDFGYAFGSATEVLPVPELVPFRMTKQLIGLLLPHAVKRGEMRQVMVHCLSALRSRSDELSPLLDVFVKDPSVDWTNFAKKSRATELQESGDDITDVTSDRTWYARRKMKIVERKLSGGNPAFITCDEVEHNADVKRFRKDYCSVAMGDSSHGNVRAQLDADNLSVDEQVDSLLDLATDPNVLGRCWQGWKSWL